MQKKENLMKVVAEMKLPDRLEHTQTCAQTA